MAIYGHNFQVFIGDYDSGSSETISDLAASATAGAGEFGVADEHGNLLAAVALTSGDKFRVVQPKQDGSLVSTPLLDFDDIVRVKAIADSTSEAFQVSNIGYTSVNTTNSVEAINSNRYALRLNFTNDGELYSEQKDQYFFEYVSDASASQQEVIDYFAANMGMMKYLADGSTQGPSRARISAERFNSASGSDMNSELNLVTVTRGSDVITCSAISSTSVTAGLVAGVYLRLDSSAGGADEPAVDPIYKVVEVSTDGNFIRLDQPYQGASVGLEDDDLHFLTKAEVDAGNAGLKLTGLAQFHKVGLFPYSMVAFDVTLDGWGSTVADTSTAPVLGNTNGEAVADMEWFALSSNSPGGASFTGTGFPSAQTYADLQAKDGTDYDVMVIEYATSGANQPHAIANGGKVKGTIVVAFEAGSAGLAASFEDLFNNASGAGTALASD